MKNTIKLNVTAPFIYSKALQLSYERLIGENQSLNVTIGYNEFPGDLRLKLSNTQFSRSSAKSGYVFGVDYRFYLQKENKFHSPHGVYLAPYISFYRFKSDGVLTYTDSVGQQTSTNHKTNISFFNIGGELGYQFVIHNRFVVDAIIFGPAVTRYNFNVKLDGSLPNLTPNETQQAVIDALKDKFPLLHDLSKNKEVNGSGREAFWAAGFRYNISIGFRF